jgi:hypothetical protein
MVEIQKVTFKNLTKHMPSYLYDRLDFANKAGAGRVLTIGFIAANGS